MERLLLRGLLRFIETAGNLGNLSEVKDIINTDSAKELNVRGFADRALEKEADKD